MRTPSWGRAVDQRGRHGSNTLLPVPLKPHSHHTHSQDRGMPLLTALIIPHL